MFTVRDTNYAGLGVFSSQILPAGSLVMREKPLLEIDPSEIKKETMNMEKITLQRHKNIETNKKTTASKVVKFCKVIEAFMKMSTEEKRNYLCLKDSFNYLENKDDDSFQLDLNTIDVAVFKEIVAVSREVAAKVWGIFNTNNFENGVFLLLSRVNHSCVPNSEFVWNSDKKTQDLRLYKLSPKKQLPL